MTCTRCPSKPSKGRKTCTRCSKRLETYRARYRRNKRLNEAFDRPAVSVLRFEALRRRYPGSCALGGKWRHAGSVVRETQHYTLTNWQRDMRKLAANLGVR